MLDLDRASEDFRSFAQSLTSRGTDWVTARDDAQRTRALCEGWIREYRPRLVAELGEVNSVIEIDGLVNWLRSRCGVKTRSEAMRESLQAIARLLDRELLPAYDTARWSSASAATSSPEQLPLLARLNGVSPAIADSYQQACIDLADDDRRTYVGPAGELREVLRGTIDQLSPDDDEIRTQPWFKGYQGKPTQAERIRATLGENDLAHQPAKALEVVDSAVGAIGRMTYSRASAGFHVLRGVERDEVTKIRCWVDVVLNEILPPT